MTGKRVPINLRPGAEKTADAWVTDATPAAVPAPAEPEAPVITKRLTIDVPMTLHRQLKVKAAMEGVKMADLVRSWIAEKCSS